MRPRKAGSKLRRQDVYCWLLEDVIVRPVDHMDLHPLRGQLAPAQVCIVCPEEPHAVYAKQGYLAIIYLRPVALQSSQV